MTNEIDEIDFTRQDYSEYIQEFDRIIILFLYYENHFINDLIHKSRYPDTCTAIYKFFKKIENIYEALPKTVSSENFYTSCILYRSIVEHYLVGYYIATKCKFDENDETANQYHNEYYTSELIKQRRYNLRVDGIVINDTNNDSLENLNKEYNTAFTYQEMERLHRIAGQFDIKRIIKYLLHDLQSDKSPINDTFGVHQMLKEYNFCSSFVHGGSYASSYLFNPSDEKFKSFHQDYQIFVPKLFMVNLLLALVEILVEDVDVDDKPYQMLATLLHSCL